MLITPLWSGEDVIGVAEMSSNDLRKPLDTSSITQAIRILQKAAEWVSYPIESDKEEKYLDLAKILLTTTDRCHCSFSYWEKEGDSVNTFLEYSNSVWSPGEGPRFILGESSHVQALIKNKILSKARFFIGFILCVQKLLTL